MTPDAHASRAAHAVRIAAVIEAEAAVFEELAALMPVQRRALLDADADEVGRCAACAETLATRFRLLEQERARLAADSATDEEDDPSGVLAAAHARLIAALETVMKDGAVGGTLLARLGDSVIAREALLASLHGAAYLPNGRAASIPAHGTALSTEG